MEYHGKLYGKMGRVYFDTGKTSKDFDEMLEALKELLPIAMEFINENHPTYKKVTELLKKATE